MPPGHSRTASARAQRRTLIGLLALTAAPGCSGQVMEAIPEESTPPPGRPTGRPSDGGATSVPPSNMPPNGAPACTTGPVAASRMRRLTNSEFVGTVRGLLGLPSDAATKFQLPGESTVNNFENAAALQSLSEQHLTGYGEVIDQTLTESFADNARRARVVGCEPTGSGRDACLRSFAESFARRAWRRPAANTDVDRLVELGRKAPTTDPYAAVSTIARATLSSPRFLFLADVGQPVAGKPDLLRLDGYTVATKAALLIWGSGPDDKLLNAARDGQLDTNAGLDTTLDWMLADPRARTGQRAFFYRWLRMRDVADADRDEKVFPAWNEALRAAMIEESIRVVDELAWQPGRDFRDVITASSTWVNAPLAKLYGLAEPAGGAWAKVEQPAERRGFLTHASFLTATGRYPKANAILRGKMIQEALLCQHMPDPPGDVPPLEETKVAPNTSERKTLEAHRINPGCAACHDMLDPLGFGLDNFDGIGRYRTVDGAGQKIDARGSIPRVPMSDYNGARELADRLRGNTQFADCITTQLYRYAVGRPEEQGDSCALTQLRTAFRTSGHSYPQLLRALVKSDAFRHRLVLTTSGGTP